MKRFLSVSAAAVLAALAVLGGPIFAGAPKSASAASPSNQTVISVTNGQFNSATSSSFPKTPSGWSGAALNGSSDAQMYNGIISMSPGVFNPDVVKDYHLGEGNAVPGNPFSTARFPDAYAEDPDSNALMINTSAAAGRYAYTSSPLTLEANKCYEISVWALTFRFSSGGASIKLVDASTNLSIGRKADRVTGEKEKLMAFRNIDTSDYKDADNYNWRKYSFSVQTSFYPVDIMISLSVGDISAEKGTAASGIAFFDNVRAKTIPFRSFDMNAAVRTEDSMAFSFETESSTRNEINAPNTSYIKNGSFDEGAALADGLTGWTHIKGGYGTQNTAPPNNPGTPAVEKLTRDDATSPFTLKADPFKNTAARIENISASASGVQSGPFVLQRYRNYRISVWYLALGGATANVSVTAEDTLENKKYGRTDLRKAVASTTSLAGAENADTENWQQASIYVQGSFISDHTVNLELWNGYGGKDNTGTHSKGVVYFDRVKIQYLDSNEYLQYSSNAGGASLDSLVSDSSIENGYFNNVEYSDYDAFKIDAVTGAGRVTAPLSPVSWTFVNGEDTGINPGAAGFDYNDTAVTRGVIPGNDRTANPPEPGKFYNILKVQNNSLSAAGYASPGIALSSGSYQKISVYVSSDDGTKAFLQLTDNGSPVAAIENIETNGRWQLYSFIISAGGSSPSLTLTLWNGWCSLNEYAPRENLSSGSVYFAAADSKSSTAEEYNQYTDGTNKTVKTVDMASNFGLFDNAAGTLKTPYAFSGLGVSDVASNAVVRGIVDTKNFDAGEISAANPGTSSDSMRYVLMINNRIPTAFEYVSKNKETLSSGSYYKVTVSVRTAEISGDGKGCGAYISLHNMGSGVKGATFSGIISNDKYTTYTFYIATGDESLSFNYEFGLGDVSRPATYTRGFAFFEAFAVTSIDNVAYNNAGTEKAVKLSFATTTSTTPENDTGKTFWDWFWLPTVIFGLAILFTLVMIGIRNVAPAVGRLYRRRKRMKLGYDRSETVKTTRAKKHDGDDESYDDVVETITVKREKPEKAAKEKAPDKTDTYNDYFED